jgi:hypothetical protein
MKSQSSRRGRIVRLRTIEQKIAVAHLASADGTLSNLRRISGKLDALRASLGTTMGTTGGQFLQGMAEMSHRLESAQLGLTQPIKAAENAQNVANNAMLQSRQKAEGATKLHERALRDETTELELRTDANRPFRKHTVRIGDEI